MYFKQPHLGSLDILTIPTMRVDHLVRYPIWVWVCLIMAFLFVVPAQAKALGCGVETIPKAHIKYRCGCGYWSQTTPLLQPILQSDFDFTGTTAFIQQQMVQVSPLLVEGLPKDVKVGDTFKQIFNYSDINISFDNIVTGVCAKNADYCEGTRFDTILNITQGSCRVSNVPISGSCGC